MMIMTIWWSKATRLLEFSRSSNGKVSQFAQNALLYIWSFILNCDHWKVVRHLAGCFGVWCFGVLVQFWKLSTFQTGGVKTNSDVVTAAKLVLVVDGAVGGRETFHKLLAPKLVGSGALLVLQSGNDKWSLGLQQLASLYSDEFAHKWTEMSRIIFFFRKQCKLINYSIPQKVTVLVQNTIDICANWHKLCNLLFCFYVKCVHCNCKGLHLPDYWSFEKHLNGMECYY